MAAHHNPARARASPHRTPPGTVRAGWSGIDRFKKRNAQNVLRLLAHATMRRGRFASAARPREALARNLQITSHIRWFVSGSRTMDQLGMGIRNLLVGVAVVLAVSACAGNDRRADAGSPEQQAIRRAEASINEAQSAGAFEQAGADLNRAREKLAKAQEAVKDGDEEIAQRLAVEAELDAEVAAATANNQEAQAALSELQETIRTLQDELRRNEQREPGRL
jgi:hypothetical protein